MLWAQSYKTFRCLFSRRAQTINGVRPLNKRLKLLQDWALVKRVGFIRIYLLYRVLKLKP
jgi:hypothetical protein